MPKTSSNFEILKKLPRKFILKENQNITLLVETFSDSKIILQKNSHLTFLGFISKGWKNLCKLDFQLTEQGSSLTFYGIMIGNKKENFPFETYTRHLSSDTKADFTIETVLLDQSQINYKGYIIIPPKGQKTISYLTHNNLILSPVAKVNTIPCLEIEADDVKASHGATIGKVDEEMMFYLESRGLTAKEAKLLMIKSFLEKNLSLIKNKNAMLEVKKRIDHETDKIKLL